MTMMVTCKIAKHCSFDFETFYFYDQHTIDNSVNVLHFHSFINSYSHQILQTSCAKSKEHDKAWDSLSHTSRLTHTHWCEVNDAEIM